MMYHQPVLLAESIEGLQIKEEGIYVDATYGGGGHSEEILKKLRKGSLIAFDHDQDALVNKLEDERLILINQNFRYMRNFLKLYKALPVDGILADLGVSSYQIDKPERGFSVRFEGELDLRMNRRKSLTAKNVVNEYSVNKLKEILIAYGELNNAYKIASQIESARSEQEIKTTAQLMEAVHKCAPRGLENKFYAKLFQALRIEVNDELGALKQLLEQSADLLKSGGRIVVISYHSLEDRLVKNFFKAGNFKGEMEKDFYGNVLTPFKLINKKPIVANDEEIKRNGRSRSAKLRIAEKL
ncbi:MAG: 16S rRNA (cytosine(1402)-N(4))-methyltransferase RsmH [Bacteroidales bacterium]